MAEGGINPREERLTRWNLVREEALRATMQMSLEDQGVMLDEEDIQDIRVSEGGEEEQANLLSIQDNNTSGTNADTGSVISEKEDGSPPPSEEIRQRTNMFQKEKARLEQKEYEMQERERLIRQHEEDLKGRQASFERALQENEERERSMMRKKMQEEMYGESLRILKDLEADLYNRKKISEQREKELQAKEREVKLKEERWKEQQKAMEIAYREKLQREVAAELSFSKGLPTSTPKRVVFLKQEESPEMITGTGGLPNSNGRVGSERNVDEDVKNMMFLKQKENPPIERIEVRLPNYSTQHSIIGSERMSNRKNDTFLTQKESPEIVRSERLIDHDTDQDRIRSDRTVDEKNRKINLESTSANTAVSDETRVIPEGSGNFDKGGKGNQSDDSGFVQKPYIGTFSGTEPRPKNESSFDDWRVDVETLIASKKYSDFVISQTIRKSLRVPAKRVLLAMSTTASSRDIISRLENVYGNVACGQAVVQEFYTAVQSAEENVAEWAVRLEEILKRAVDKGQIIEASRDEILRSKFWRGLFSQDLKNATKIYYESERNFEKLLYKVRSEEYELRKPEADSKKKSTGARAQHNPIQGMPENQIEILTKLCDRIDSIEKKLQTPNYNRDNYRGGRGGGRGRGRGRGKDKRFSNQNKDSEKQGQDSDMQETVPKQSASDKKTSKNE